MKSSTLAVASVFIALALTGCHSERVRISGKLIGLNSKMVYLEQVSSLSGQNIIDSVALAEDGSYRFEIERVASSPSMYNISYNNERVPLLLTGGENVVLSSLGSMLANYTVSGSKESELLRIFNRDYIEGLRRLNTIMNEYASARSDEERTIKSRAYTEQYRAVKRNQISFIVEHKNSIAAIYALYQRLPGEQYLVGVDSDIVYFRTVADAVSEVYPDSPYLVTLRNEIARMEARSSLLQSIEVRSYPELTAPDMYGNEVSLSSLEGNIILLDFWSAEAGNSNALNADLKELYAKYYDKGFRVYQVAVDRSKATWIKAVQEQRLPWISVCDFKGEASPLTGIYNVRKLPSNFLIDREGNIVAKDIYSTALDHRLEELCK